MNPVAGCRKLTLGGIRRQFSFAGGMAGGDWCSSIKVLGRRLDTEDCGFLENWGDKPCSQEDGFQGPG